MNESNPVGISTSGDSNCDMLLLHSYLHHAGTGSFSSYKLVYKKTWYPSLRKGQWWKEQEKTDTSTILSQLVDIRRLRKKKGGGAD